MNQRPARARRGSLAARHGLDLLLSLLVVAAPALRLARGGRLAAAAAAWGAAAVAAALVAAVRREPAAAVAHDGTVRGEDAARDLAGHELRLLFLAVAAASAVAAVAAAATGGDPAVTAAFSFLRLGIGGAAVVVAAVRFWRWWWAAPSLAGVAALLEAAQAVTAGWAGAPAGAWPALGAAAALALLAHTAGRAFAGTRDECAKARDAVREQQRLAGEAEALHKPWVDRRQPKTRSLTPEGRRARAARVVEETDRGLDRVLGLARRAVGARSVALFLLAGDRSRLALRRAAGEKGAPVDPDAAPVVGVGVVGQVAKTRRPALFTNLGPESLRPPLYAGEVPSPSLVAVPVSEAGVLRGVLLADAAEPGAFGQEHESLLSGFAAEVATLLEAASAAAGSARVGDRFETLAAISGELSSTIKVDEMLAKMLARTREVVPCDRCAVFIADEPSRTLALRAERGFFPEQDEKDEGRRAERLAGAEPIGFDRGLAGFVATSRERVNFSDLAERGPAIEIVPGSEGQERIRSFLGLPLLTQEGLVGVWVLAAEKPGNFDAEHVELLTVVAAQAAVLISNAVLHQTVERLATTDGLTGLYNHRSFQERLQAEVERGERHGQPVSLLLLDIDHFKKINDTHGHPFGDTVLKALAGALGGLARRVDFVARYGGEEFAIILVNTDRRGCRTYARRVLKTVRALRVPREGGTFSFTLSVGAATCPDDARSREQLVRCADRALYAAKRGGRDRAVAFQEVAGEPAAPGEAPR